MTRNAWLLAGCTYLFCAPVHAQQTAQNNASLEEIVVTAQKRSENLQDTPLAISAVTADTINKRGITDVSACRGHTRLRRPLGRKRRYLNPPQNPASYADR